MKTQEEINKIKAGLECCSADECHGANDECPYHENCICVIIMAGQARAYINELEERISLMMIQMRGDCGVCKYRYNPAIKNDDPCTSCLPFPDKPKWEYEGLPEVKSK